jgi:hypothetical protein
VCWSQYVAKSEAPRVSQAVARRGLRARPKATALSIPSAHPPTGRPALCGGRCYGVTIPLMRANPLLVVLLRGPHPGAPAALGAGVARLCALPTYQRRQPEGSVLYRASRPLPRAHGRGTREAACRPSHGLLAPHAAGRAQVVSRPRQATNPNGADERALAFGSAGLSWHYLAQTRLRPRPPALPCPRCVGRRQIVGIYPGGRGCVICCSAWGSPIPPSVRPRPAPGERAGCSSPRPSPGLAPRLPSPLARGPVAMIVARSCGHPAQFSPLLACARDVDNHPALAGRY